MYEETKLGAAITIASSALTASATRTAAISHSTRTRGGETGNVPIGVVCSATIPGRPLPVIAKWNLTIVFPQEVQEPFVIARFHVEEPGDDLVVDARFFEAAPHNFPRVRSGDVPIHEQRIHDRPERFLLF